jgi:hypothetical protein
VLVVDDTWVSGGSAQSTAAALKLAGARRVAVVVLGRHVNPADPRSAALLESVRAAGEGEGEGEGGGGGGDGWPWRGSAPRNFPDAVPSRRACSS